MENKNKKVRIWGCLLFLLIAPVLGQETVDAPKSSGLADDFKLTVEPAWITLGQPNTKGKSKLEKKFFPDHNRMVEFFFRDSLLGTHGFRIDTVNMDNYIMEVVWVTDFKGEYTIERRKVPINVTLAGQVWKSYHGIMKYYFSRGIAPPSSDGYSVTFRCVVEDFSLWTFFARNPLSHIKDLSTACNKIVKEVQENGKIMNEEEHIKQLDNILTKALLNHRGARTPGMELKLDSVKVIRFSQE